MQPLLDSPPQVHPYAKGSWGPAGGGRPRGRCTAAGAVPGCRREHGEERRGARTARAPPRLPRSHRSPTTPFSRTATPARWWRRTARSTGSAFRASTHPASSGSCSTARRASFRLGPFGINVPTARIYEPGTNIVITTWKTPTGWAMVRDALTMGPRAGEDKVTPHTRPPADDDGDHMLVRTMLCLDGSVEMELICEPDFDYGRVPGEWSLVGDERHTADASRRRPDDAGCRPTWRSASRATGFAHATRWSRASRPTARSPGQRTWPCRKTVDEANERMAATTRYWRRWLAGARMPDHRWRDPIQRSALAIKGLTYMPTGATVAAATTSLPETPGGERNWDYRFTWMRDSTFTLQALHFLNLDWEADEFMQFVADLEPNEDGGAADHVRDRRAARPDRVHPRRALRLRGRQPGPGRQRRLRPAPERRLRRGARLDPAAHAAAASACPGGCGRSSRPRPSARPRSGASPTRASGRRAASPSTTSPRS